MNGKINTPRKYDFSRYCRGQVNRSHWSSWRPGRYSPGKYPKITNQWYHSLWSIRYWIPYRIQHAWLSTTRTQTNCCRRNCLSIQANVCSELGASTWIYTQKYTSHTLTHSWNDTDLCCSDAHPRILSEKYCRKDSRSYSHTILEWRICEDESSDDEWSCQSYSQ